ncbi:hypothetical protein V8J88_09790 [Massilia sp. W12]|uniref:hypothetical protein n=1 Tax=Massilia sp. W12 TaxID=3126507 RepID=UPI0030D24B91
MHTLSHSRQLTLFAIISLLALLPHTVSAQSASPAKPSFTLHWHSAIQTYQAFAEAAPQNWRAANLALMPSENSGAMGHQHHQHHHQHHQAQAAQHAPEHNKDDKKPAPAPHAGHQHQHHHGSQP